MRKKVHEPTDRYWQFPDRSTIPYTTCSTCCMHVPSKSIVPRESSWKRGFQKVHATHMPRHTWTPFYSRIDETRKNALHHAVFGQQNVQNLERLAMLVDWNRKIWPVALVVVPVFVVQVSIEWLWPCRRWGSPGGGTLPPRHLLALDSTLTWFTSVKAASENGGGQTTCSGGDSLLPTAAVTANPLIYSVCRSALRLYRKFTPFPWLRLSQTHTCCSWGQSCTCTCMVSCPRSLCSASWAGNCLTPASHHRPFVLYPESHDIACCRVQSCTLFHEPQEHYIVHVCMNWFYQFVVPSSGTVAECKNTNCFCLLAQMLFHES